MQVLIDEDRLLVLGGTYTPGNDVVAMMLNLKTKQWTRLPDMPNKHGAGSACELTRKETFPEALEKFHD